MKMLQESIHKTDGLNNQIFTLFFDPWYFQDSREMVENIFKEYSTKLEENLDDGFGDEEWLTESIVKYGEWLASQIPIPNLQSVELTPSFLGIIKFTIRVGNSKKNQPVDNIKELQDSIQARTYKMNKFAILFIDHIDHLDVEKAKLLLESVEAIREHFSKTIIVFTYEHNKLEDKLTEPHKGIEGQKLINSVIDVPLILPRPDNSQFSSEAFEKLEKAMSAILQVPKENLMDDGDEVANALKQEDVLPYILDTPREIKQCASSLCLDARLVGVDFIHPADLMAIHVLKFKFPRFYYKMKYREYVFLVKPEGGQKEGESLEETAYRIRKEKYEEEYLNLLPKPYRKPVDTLCKALFPQLAGKEVDPPTGPATRVCYDGAYEKYMVLPLEEKNIRWDS